MSYSRGRVLVTDDDRGIVMLIADLLEDEGYVVQKAYDGQDALNQAIDSPPDLILLDLHMPVMDGWACYRSLRQHPETVDVPIIVMSSDGLQAAVDAGLEVEHFLRKPFRIADLVSCVRRYTRSHIG